MAGKIMFMAYTTEHHAREWLGAAALMVCHDYNLRCQYLPTQYKQQLLSEAFEIDLHARLASFFGPAATIAANGQEELDVVVSAPTLNAEVKYLMAKRNGYKDQIADKDWAWLLGYTSANSNFERNAWVVFLPSVDLYSVTECISVPKGHGQQYSLQDFAPLCPFVEPCKYASSESHKLVWRSSIERLQAIVLPGGKAVRVDLIGSPNDYLWAMVYTRIVGEEGRTLPGVKVWDVDDTAISATRRAGDDAD